MKKTLKNLSLVFAGIVVGVVISYSPDIYAASSKLLGTKITKVMNVNYNSKFIGEAPVINGVSYIPVRAAANELGLGIEVEKEINLIAPEVTESSTEPTLPDTSTTAPVVDNTEKIKKLNEQINYLKESIAQKEREQLEYTEHIKSEPDPDSKDYASQKNIYDMMKQKYNTNARLLETQKKNLADYESQLAELKK